MHKNPFPMRLHPYSRGCVISCGTHHAADGLTGIPEPSTATGPGVIPDRPTSATETDGGAIVQVSWYFPHPWVSITQ
ncbi:MAG: hypothetical protein ACE5R6_13600 [Candidatus Heimdallarchaeota archaeon]